MHRTINSYFAALIVTIVGSGAALLIIHIANLTQPEFIRADSQREYAELRKQILEGTTN